MKKLLFVGLLMLVGSALAEWTFVVKTDDVNYYADYATFRKEADLRKIWVLMSGKSDSKAKSIKTKMEFDCKKEQSRLSYISTHSGLMGRGQILDVKSEGMHGFVDIPPDSPFNLIFNIVCSK